MTVAAVDTGTGVATVEFRLDGGAWTAYTDTIVLDDAGHTVQARATDRSGNASGVSSLSGPAVASAATPVLTANGAARTVVVGASVAAGSVNVADTDGFALVGVPVTFVVNGPASFPGGATSVRVLSDALGVAAAPALTTSVVGTVRVTASASEATGVTLPSVAVVAKAKSLTVGGSATASIVSGRGQLSVAVTNTSSETVTIRLKSTYGTKTFTSVAPNASSTAVFKTALKQILAGAVTVEVSTADASNTVELAYGAAR